MTTMTTANLVVNGDAETGAQAADFSSTDAPAGWTVTGSFTQVQYAAGGPSDLNAADGAAVYGGNGYFAGGVSSGLATAFQTIDVGAYASAIDAGTLNFDASGDFGGYLSQNDNMVLNLTFYAADGATSLGTVSVGGVNATDRGGATELLYEEASGAIPGGTRFIKVELDATRTDGSYNDGYADNISLVLTGANVPGGAVLVNATHDFSSDTMPKSNGIAFVTSAPATATFIANDFAPSRISHGAVITGDHDPDTLVVKTANAFDASGFTFSDWTSGVDSFQIDGTKNGDTITGAGVDDRIAAGDGNDTIVLSSGGNDVVNGGAGDDVIMFGNALTAADRVDGSTGTDTVDLAGDYSAGLNFAKATIKNVENLVLNAGFSYKLATHDGNVAAGATLNVDGANLGASDTLSFNGSHETDGRFTISGGQGNDTLTGGAQGDTISGGVGADTLKGGGGADVFRYFAVGESTGVNHDTILDFDTSADTIDIGGLGVSVGAMDATIASGKLIANNFDATLAAAVKASTLHAHDAVLFTPDVGGLAGHTFLVVDVNGTAGYQAGQDLVIDLGTGNMSGFSVANITG
ncbi:MAG TPA: calcium-binding protein [Rhizomicrobium sp.]|nr:calcium-binding protein [Rhizomicrobium sp.]